MRTTALFVLIALSGCIYPGQSMSDNTIDHAANDPFVLECVGGMVEASMAALATGALGMERIEDVVDLWSVTVPDVEVVLEANDDRARLALVQAATGRTIAVISMVNLGNGWLEESKERCANP